MDIRRFGPGSRRPDGPPGTQGLAGQVIWTDARAHVSELAFSRHAVLAPHIDPDTGLLIVVSGGGWVQVGDERSRIRHGEAVVVPAGVPYGAWTDGTDMRVIVVELPEVEGVRVLKADAAHVTSDQTGPSIVTAAQGSLAERLPDRDDHDASEGEPW